MTVYRVTIPMRCNDIEVEVTVCVEAENQHDAARAGGLEVFKAGIKGQPSRDFPHLAGRVERADDNDVFDTYSTPGEDT